MIGADAIPALALPPVPQALKAGSTVQGAADARMRETAREFEAVFLSMLLKQMRESLEPEGLFPGDTGDIQGGLFDLYLGRHLAENGGVGMAAALLRQIAPPIPTLVRELLERLEDEELLLRRAVTAARESQSAIRGGQLSADADTAKTQAELATGLDDAARRRIAAGAALAAALGLPPDRVNLSSIRRQLDDDLADSVDQTQQRLAAVVAELTAVLRRNAILVQHLRSYFRCVLSVLTSGDGTSRYSQSGSRLSPAGGAAILTHG